MRPGQRHPAIHVVEPGGRGGVYQHAVALAGALAHAGVPVVLHTAADPEALPAAPRVERRACLWRCSSVRPRAVRQLAVGLGWLVRGVPTCVADVRAGDTVHVQGRFHPVLLVPLFGAVRGRRAQLAFTPHTTYSRTGRQWEERLVRWLARRADVVFAFSGADRDVLVAAGADVVVAPFPFVTPDPAPDEVARWRRRWDGDRVVLFAGQVRADKRLDLAVGAVAGLGGDTVLAVVGEDRGGLAPALGLADRMGVRVAVDEGFQPLDRFLAAVAAADAVVCPYRVASQSGVLAVAAALGRPTVASDVGGLAEVATVVVPSGDVEALTAGLRRALAAPPPDPVRSDRLEVAAAYLAAYGLPMPAVR